MNATNKPRRHFDREFKENAVRLLASSGKPVSELAEELGVSIWSLSRWKQQFSSAASTPMPEKTAVDPQVEIQRLKHQLAYVTEQREILKEALAICSKEQGPPGGSNW